MEVVDLRPASCEDHGMLPLVCVRTPFVVLSFIVLALSDAAGEITVSSDFPGGSAEVVTVDQAQGVIEITPKAIEGRGWPCWWYLRVDGAEPGRELTLKVRAHTTFRRETEMLSASWALPRQAVWSTDDVEWRQTDPITVTGPVGAYAIKAPASRFWMAWGPPFVPAHAEEALAAAAKTPGTERFTLATTREGRVVPGIRFGEPTARRAIWLNARQHAWEAGGSWVGRGFLDWVASADPAAVALRQSTEIFFIPIMDVDNVVHGMGGKEAKPRDHNRDWGNPPIYPEVAAAQARLKSLADAGRLRIYIDLHNPGPGDKRPYFYGPYDYEQLEPAVRQRYDNFHSLAGAAMTGPLPLVGAYRFATYVKTDEERGRMSANWVRIHGGQKAIGMTLETAWNTPVSTQESYLTVGQQLGQAIAAYMASEDAQ